MSRDRDADADTDDLSDVEVERMPNLDGWEYFKAIDGAEERERWTLAMKPKPDQRAFEYALWTDIKGDPTASGVLDARQEKDKRWAKAVRKAIESSDDGAIDNEARAEIALTILKRHDPLFDGYEDRLLFTLDSRSDEDDEDSDGDDGDDGDDDDDDND